MPLWHVNVSLYVSSKPWDRSLWTHPRSAWGWHCTTLPKSSYFFSFQHQHILFSPTPHPKSLDYPHYPSQYFQLNSCWGWLCDLCGWHFHIYSSHIAIWIRSSNRELWSYYGLDISEEVRFSMILYRVRGKCRSFLCGYANFQYIMRDLLGVGRKLW